MREWLIAMRKESGFSQKYVSEQSGISQPAYCAIEKDVNQPTVKTAKAIADALGFDWTKFYED